MTASTTTPSGDDAPLLAVDGLSVQFQTRRGTAHVLDEVGFTLARGQTLGLVGESGCGKSMTALAMMRLIPQPPGRIAAGSVRLHGRELLALPEAEMRRVRGNRLSMIFQEPMTSLNPVFTIGEQIAESVRLHLGLDRRAALAHAVDMLAAVGIPAPARRAHDYPHHFSGGMRQRAMIAMALACSPDALIADEPTTALDVTVQAQIFDLMAELRERTGTAILLITHDMGAVAEMADRVAVMYAGRIVEEGGVHDILERPLHPYTQGLVACAPGRRRTAPGETLREIPGTVPSLLRRAEACAFAERCEHARPLCRQRPPPGSQPASGRRVRCWLYPETTPADTASPA
ncbi:ABC transporter ATP-binding protein [Pseudothauera nasutitermitis]|uniref:ABC transporter ATP-binding protein n=1 Tax=Pseudothauera nasutitermitis TaxID=2565930 RepID=A0A4V3WCI4_9RHOO|nr:ABC transporter ATP-binding protein [Pseudothauera nasutitermitis]THF67274.1 ABC transporter ATP-binding protein [Pseudothauera nasutitermitis]